MMGLPVITTRYSGLDDGHLDDWAIPIEKMKPDPIPTGTMHMRGEWMRPDVDELAQRMRWCYENQQAAAMLGRQSALWLRENQTWEHSAQKLLDLIKRYA